MAGMEAIINDAWENRAELGFDTTGEVRDAVEQALADLDAGRSRVAEKVGGEWHVHQWLKKAVLLSFVLNDMRPVPGGPDTGDWWDKVASKFRGWDEATFRAAGFRAVPTATVRHSAYIAPSVVLMPSFVNVGAYVVAARWWTLGPRSALVPRSARTATFRAAPASAACSNRCRRSR